MRKLISGAFVSLDGVIEKPWEWIGNYFDQEGKDYASQKLDGAEIFLLGRKTYERFSSTWVHVKGDGYLDRVNAIEKRVVSQTLSKVDWNASLIKGDPATAIAALKNEPGKDIIKYGIGRLDEALLKEDLIDEIELWMIPVKIGGGKRLFEEVDLSGIELELKKTRIFGNGVVLLTYSPKKVRVSKLY